MTTSASTVGRGQRIAIASAGDAAAFLKTGGCSFVLGTGNAGRGAVALHLAAYDDRGRMVGVGWLTCAGDREPEMAVAVLEDSCSQELLCGLVRATARSIPQARRICSCVTWDGAPPATTIANAGLTLCAQAAFDGFTDVVYEIDDVDAAAGAQ